MNRNKNLRSIYKKYVNSIFRYFFVRTGNRDLSLDLTSITFEKVIKNISTYDKQKGSLATWLFTIARNVFIDHLRRSQKYRENLSMEEDIHTLLVTNRNNSDEQSVYISDEAKMVRELIATLDEKEQLLVHLRFTEELSYQEIAKELNMTENAVGIKLHRIIKKLRNLARDKNVDIYG